MQHQVPRRLDRAGVLVSDPEIAGGAPIFRGTRVPASTLFDYLQAGISIHEILAEFPTLDRDDVLTVLREAHDLVVGEALPPAAE